MITSGRTTRVRAMAALPATMAVAAPTGCSIGSSRHTDGTVEIRFGHLRLRYATANGSQISYSILREDAEIPLPGQPTRSTPGEIRAMIPSSAIIEPGAGFHWSAELVQNIHPVDSCPAVPV